MITILCQPWLPSVQAPCSAHVIYILDCEKYFHHSLLFWLTLFLLCNCHWHKFLWRGVSIVISTILIIPRFAFPLSNHSKKYYELLKLWLVWCHIVTTVIHFVWAATTAWNSLSGPFCKGGIMLYLSDAAVIMFILRPFVVCDRVVYNHNSKWSGPTWYFENISSHTVF